MYIQVAKYRMHTQCSHTRPIAFRMSVVMSLLLIACLLRSATIADTIAENEQSGGVQYSGTVRAESIGVEIEVRRYRGSLSCGAEHWSSAAAMGLRAGHPRWLRAGDWLLQY